ncbi:MAG: AAA family ATPase, partial [Vulcanimicrobiaceae bacterium]
AILARRAQAHALSERLPAIRERIATCEAALRAAQDEAAQAAAEHEAARRRENEAALGLRDTEAALAALAATQIRIDEELAAVAERAAGGAREGTRNAARLAELERPPADAGPSDERRRALEGSLAEARTTIAFAEERERELAAEHGAARDALTSAQAAVQGASNRLLALEDEAARGARANEALEGDRSALAGERAGAKDAIVAAGQALGVREARLLELARLREDDGARAQRLEDEARAAREAERRAAQTGEGGRRRLAEIDAELGILASQFAQHPASAQECDEVEARYAGEDEATVDELPRLREDLARLQNVNLGAEGELAEQVEREGYLQAQLDDIGRARETLLASIGEIERGSHEQFARTFAQVAQAFGEVYGELFPGGRARMSLAGEAAEEAGIEIEVQPPGKRPMALGALSGGERAMAASALIFALIRVRPSPFYLLDEVDAALDDANVERFAAFVRELVTRSQLVLVTHNKRTMELADRLYGITMAEPGISSLIATELEDSARRAEVERALAV